MHDTLGEASRTCPAHAVGNLCVPSITTYHHFRPSHQDWTCRRLRCKCCHMRVANWLQFRALAIDGIHMQDRHSQSTMRFQAPGSRPLSKTVHFVRHGQAEHNVALAKVAKGEPAPTYADSRPNGPKRSRDLSDLKICIHLCIYIYIYISLISHFFILKYLYIYICIYLFFYLFSKPLC